MLARMRASELSTPALIVDRATLEENLATMTAALQGPRLRPHVKAHKCTALAKLQARAGHRTFTCATPREIEGMARAGLGEDLLLANEVVDDGRLARLADLDARVTVAVDSDATIDAAARNGIREVLVDVNVGLPRCGCDPGDAGRLADLARSRGLTVRGVMGYEGHVVGVEDRAARVEQTAACMELLVKAHADTGGDVVSAGGTGTYDINTWANEIQAGSYALMDGAYDKLELLPFRPALSVQATVISVSPGWAVADCGLKALGMDHGNPTITGGSVRSGEPASAMTVWYCSDEHVTFSADAGDGALRVGDRVTVWPAHIDPTVAYHERMHLVDGDDVVETWAVDLRGW
jgi:D-serine deaminase-like pyridoxal phosphate-dependent protein